MSRNHWIVAAVLIMAWIFGHASRVAAARYDGRLTITVVDQQSGQRIAARMELRDRRGRAVRVKPQGAVSLGNSFVFDGEATLELRRGAYRFLIEAGPEYQTRPGHFTMERHAEDSTQIALLRRVNMRDEGWWAGDLDVSRRLQQMPLLMRASGVDLAPVAVAANIRGKCRQEKIPANEAISELSPPLFGPWAALDQRRGGGLLFLFADAPVDVCNASAEGPSLPMLRAASAAGADVVALTPFAWDLPLWIASGKLDAIQIIHRHALRDGVVDNEGWGRARDKTFYPGKLGNGRWTEAIYHHVLNCGLRIAPAAGSGAGFNQNPVGTNRVYVHCGRQFTRDAWRRGLREGRVTVTNGPLLRTRVEGHPPGHLFQLEPGESRDFQIALQLTFYKQSPVEYLEVVKNGRTLYEVRLDELAQQQGRLPPVHFDGSGWFLVRAMTSNAKTYQFASTGPYYVESEYQRRISRTSVQFFLDWLDDAAEKFAGNAAVRAEIEAARPFWQDLLAQANAD